MDSSSLFDVRGKTAVVSGGSRGIGAMITEALVTNGARVFVVSRKASQCDLLCRQVNERVGTAAAKALPLAADLSLESECERVARAIAEQCSMVHILVNNAGCNWYGPVPARTGPCDPQVESCRGAPFDEYPMAAFEKVFRLNVFGAFALTKLLAPLLRKAASAEDPARVINIGSVNGVMPPHLDTYAYSTSKAALHMMTKVLAGKLALQHINVNAVMPGPFNSDMMKATLQRHRSMIIGSVPQGRIGEPADIAGIILFLSSKGSSYITGALIPVDGGVLIAPKM